MSLLDDFAHTCVLLEKTRVFGDEGGWDTIWTDGPSFQNYATLETSMQARIAEQQGVTSTYSVLVNKSVPLEYGDYFRDTAINETFRITSNPNEKKAPDSSTLDLKFFTAEKREVPR